uniref:C-type lectin 3 n=1 Tax=Sistrurus tergeminus TaxID=8757 RepID=A0A194ASN9_SISTE
MGRFLFVSFGLLVGFFSLSGTGADLKCPSGWSPYRQYCYTPFRQEMTWADAERFCTEQAKGGHLVSIKKYVEGLFVHTLLSMNQKHLSPYVWIGLRVQNEGQQCSSISYGNLVDPFECFVVASDTKFTGWYKVDCGQLHSFMCTFTRPR